MFLLCVVKTFTSGKPAGNGVYDLTTSSSIVFRGIISPPVPLSTMVAFSGSRGCAVSLPWGFFFAWGTLAVRLLCTKRCRFPAWISSSILSFKAWHSSVEWLVFLWYRPFLLQSAFLGIRALLGGGINPSLAIFFLSQRWGVCIVRTEAHGYPAWGRLART